MSETKLSLDLHKCRTGPLLAKFRCRNFTPTFPRVQPKTVVQATGDNGGVTVADPETEVGTKSDRNS